MSHGYGMRPFVPRTGTLVSLPAQQPPRLVTLPMPGVSKDGICPRGHWLPSTVYNRNCLDPESGLWDTLSLGAGRRVSVLRCQQAGRPGAVTGARPVGQLWTDVLGLVSLFLIPSRPSFCAVCVAPCHHMSD